MFCVTVLVLAVLALWYDHQDELRHARRTLFNLSHTLAEQTSQTLETIDLGLRAGLSQLRDVPNGAADAEQNVRALRAHTDALAAVVAIGVYGAQGEFLVGSTRDSRQLPQSLIDSGILAAHRTRKTTGLHLSMPMRSQADGRWFLIASRRIEGSNRELRGIIAAKIDSQLLAGMYQAIDLGSNASVALFGWNGTLIASHPWRDDLIGRSYADLSALADPTHDEAYPVRSRKSPLDGQEVLAVDTPLRGFPLTLTFMAGRTAVLAPWRRHAAVGGGGALVIGILALALAMLLDRHIRRGDEAVARMREHQAELTEAQRIARLGSFRIESGTGAIHWSLQAAGLLGVPAVRLPDFDALIEHVLEEDRTRVREAWSTLQARGGLDVEFRTSLSGGEIRWLRARAESPTASGDNSAVTRGTLVDVTDERRAEQTVQHLAAVVASSEIAQQDADERLRGVASNIPGIVFEYRLRPDGTAAFEYVSERTLDMLEERPETLMRDPRTMFKLVDPAYRRQLLRSMRTSRAARALWMSEMPIRTRSGRVRWVRGQSMPRYLDDGSVIWDGVIVDVTAQKQAEHAIQHMNEQLERRVAERTAQLSAANRELESFAYSVSHDLRAPLRSIDGFSRILHEEIGGQLDATASDYLARVRNAAVRMGQLIDDLLSLSRVTRGELKRVRTDLSAIAEVIVQDLRAEAPGRSVDVSIHPGMLCLADPNLMRIVLQNLIGNAWKFTSRRAQASIEFGVFLQRTKTVYYVRDDGAGFDMGHAGKLFNAFQRLHSAREFEGTGIGLATVMRIIDRHGGAVWAQAAIDRGATFYFTLSGGGGQA